MDRRAVIIGGSIGGLAGALGLARRGWLVTIVERDPAPDTSDGDEAFVAWNRRNVPQFRQPHGFSARSRNLLLEHAPDVVDRLAADGIETTNIFKMLAPQEMWTADDDRFDGLMTRRPAFELALRRAAEAQRGIEFACPANASGLVIEAGDVPRVAGVRLDDGTELRGDVVLDCGGRRTLVPGWLAAAGVDIPHETQDCDTTYYTRYFRLTEESELPTFAVLSINNNQIEGAVSLLGFPGEKRTFALCLATQSGDDELRALRHNEGWCAAMALFPATQAWLDPSAATPINDVEVMGGSRNIRRHFIVDGRALVRGLLPVGDALCSTNPQYGWGASMALTYAFAAVEAITANVDNLDAMLADYEAAVAPEADGVYRESAAMDRARIYRWRGIDIPADDEEEMRRQELIAYVGRAATRDPVLGRAFLRRSNLLDRPDQILDDPEVMAKALDVKAYYDQKATSRPGPTREDLVAALEEAPAAAR
jgi:2-polyprenyl-6-methoxyphenol hydroxylase-like FAD-dependent oxidoreductase